MAAAPGSGHDIIVIGASLGGVEALRRVVSDLPADLPASLFVVQHVASGAVAFTLPETLTAAGPLRAVHAIHGGIIEHGVIYVAPPDNHLMLRRGALHVVRGPKENGHRPAVDTLFRSAARAYGPRVVGVVLTGGQDCGTGGLLSIKARGGLAVVQDPHDAEAPDMPTSAIAHVDVDHVLPLAAMGGLITRLARSPPRALPAGMTVPRSVLELEGDLPGGPAELVCPLCQGVLKTSSHEGFNQFRCHEGHTFSLADVAMEQAESLERALWAASRALEESAALSARMATTASGAMQKRFAEKEQTQREHAQLLRRILFSDGRLSVADVSFANLSRALGRGTAEDASGTVADFDDADARPPADAHGANALAMNARGVDALPVDALPVDALPVDALPVDAHAVDAHAVALNTINAAQPSDGRASTKRSESTPPRQISKTTAKARPRARLHPSAHPSAHPANKKPRRAKKRARP